ncbi:hypothetical protein CYLTODRAFT_156684 [Cylindrobasidium torrendii FP15055 ss-10]|uniref:Uncharacterized protein n=1 Tax=Cylindrobasidium torrendii FP15055 ss-10 TaxID=1314674 RepID=A0A0D7BKG8_9AGAR|nr:hypothetical protein CYLTODRAFT_156684 [Cylindrobasidium torrendii FP15055 ss-10]
MLPSTGNSTEPTTRSKFWNQRQKSRKVLGRTFSEGRFQLKARSHVSSLTRPSKHGRSATLRSSPWRLRDARTRPIKPNLQTGPSLSTNSPIGGQLAAAQARHAATRPPFTPRRMTPAPQRRRIWEPSPSPSKRPLPYCKPEPVLAVHTQVDVPSQNRGDPSIACSNVVCRHEAQDMSKQRKRMFAVFAQQLEETIPDAFEEKGVKQDEHSICCALQEVSQRYKRTHSELERVTEQLMVTEAKATALEQYHNARKFEERVFGERANKRRRTGQGAQPVRETGIQWETKYRALREDKARLEFECAKLRQEVLNPKRTHETQTATPHDGGGVGASSDPPAGTAHHPSPSSYPSPVSEVANNSSTRARNTSTLPSHFSGKSASEQPQTLRQTIIETPPQRIQPTTFKSAQLNTTNWSSEPTPKVEEETTSNEYTPPMSFAAPSQHQLPGTTSNAHFGLSSDHPSIRNAHQVAQNDVQPLQASVGNNIDMGFLFPAATGQPDVLPMRSPDYMMSQDAPTVFDYSGMNASVQPLNIPDQYSAYAVQGDAFYAPSTLSQYHSQQPTPSAAFMPNSMMSNYQPSSLGQPGFSQQAPYYGVQPQSAQAFPSFGSTLSSFGENPSLQTSVMSFGGYNGVSHNGGAQGVAAFSGWPTNPEQRNAFGYASANAGPSFTMGDAQMDAQDQTEQQRKNQTEQTRNMNSHVQPGPTFVPSPTEAPPVAHASSRRGRGGSKPPRTTLREHRNFKASVDRAASRPDKGKSPG